MNKENSVIIDYSIRIGEEVIDSNESFKLSLGSKEVIPGFVDNIMDMEQGQEKEFDISLSYNESLLDEIPSNELPAGSSIGGVLTGIEEDTNIKRSWRIIDIKDGKAILDGNHVFAGKTLSFNVNLKEIL